MTLAGWLNRRSGATWRARKVLLEGRLMARMNKFTLLDDAVRGFGSAAAEGWVGETDRQRQRSGLHDSGGVRRHLFGVGEGLAEAGVGAKQDRETGVSQRLRKVAEWVKSGSVVTCQPLVVPLVNHLYSSKNLKFAPVTSC